MKSNQIKSNIKSRMDENQKAKIKRFNYYFFVILEYNLFYPPKRHLSVPLATDLNFETMTSFTLCPSIEQQPSCTYRQQQFIVFLNIFIEKS